MFGTLDIDKELYFQRLTEIAIYNLNNSGIPTLSTVQMFDIVKELTQSISEGTNLINILLVTLRYYNQNLFGFSL